jgi:ATP-dependent DNA ligase
VRRYFLEYSKGGIFIPVDDELGQKVTLDTRTVRRLETGATIEAYYNGERIQIRMQKLASTGGESP